MATTCRVGLSRAAQIAANSPAAPAPMIAMSTGG